MTRFLDREKARVMRAEGKSYSEIKVVLGVSKGTLSAWLADMPLSAGQIRQLRDLNPKRIENFRETMRKKREERLEAAYKNARKDIGKLTQRDVFIAGLCLYWAEGTKSLRGKTEIANTDPMIIKAFLEWLKIIKIPVEKLSVRLQLYSDMDVRKETAFWSNVLGIPKSRFRKPRVKTSSLAGLTRKHGHGHGTCDLIFDNVPMWEYITMALKYIREQHMRP